MTYTDYSGTHTNEVLGTSTTLWLKFDATARRFYGTPTVNDIIKNTAGYYSNFVIVILS